jgi:hypothetical protein
LSDLEDEFKYSKKMPCLDMDSYLLLRLRDGRLPQIE